MQEESSLTRFSKFLSYILRHHPESIGLELDSHGWAHIPTLIRKAEQDGKSLSREKLHRVIESGTKNRFTISDDGEYIRAGYGHSIDVDLSLTPQTPPGILYHGTAGKNVESILENGLHSGSRNYVHLSAEKEDAVSVGQRHGKPVILTIHSQEMHEEGYPFYRSESEKSIWLVERVPEEFISH